MEIMYMKLHMLNCNVLNIFYYSFYHRLRLVQIHFGKKKKKDTYEAIMLLSVLQSSAKCWNCALPTNERKGQWREGLKLLKSKQINYIRVKMATSAFGRPDTNNHRKIIRSLYCFKNNSPYEADYTEDEHKSHESFKKNSGIQYFHLFNIARSDAIPHFANNLSKQIHG